MKTSKLTGFPLLLPAVGSLLLFIRSPSNIVNILRYFS